ncbi:hypothetical protein CryarDRAFT_0898 [Cryptosporangium arvum DSM 44712]|uniref:Uncharacterized protein n=1 Tax=Cryptosporangium arvum DSM 44712 TaxID=927661 RepID=A0A010ZRL2_9ACTN|nr:hypothetical protein CryarDRAFT_0898 [Cryptosporangium arvum DSM 44712]
MASAARIQGPAYR